MNKGSVFVVSAASGTGKTSLTTRLLQQDKSLHLAISHTTREPRKGEIDGVHYHFVDKDIFAQMIGEGAFLEHAIVHGNYYGTDEAEIDKMRNMGIDVLLEIDIQGATQVRQAMPEAVGIFILPPSFSALATRLGNRATDSEEVIALRLKNAREEIESAYLFDYLVINDDFDEALRDLSHIIGATRLTQKRNEKELTRLLME